MRKFDAAAHAVLTEKVASLLSKNTIEEIKTRESRYYRNLLVVPKNTGGSWTSTGSEKYEYVRVKEDFQNGDSEVDIPYGTSEELQKFTISGI
ncbi:hypothetical protein AYI70_g10826 [Smittium culicis]|uniref:Uncharacterized protein n=1 Tax=Smittium culicis TaxID=133412 RepID=A0A1R1X4X6_9FUNG|nr:hypothetical protein AYI70_g10826 [Smittium culicis]